MGGASGFAGQVSDLIERDADLALIDDVVQGVAAGAPTLTIIEGSAGLGKTALLGAARERANAMNVTVLNARGSDLEEGHSFGVVRQLFEPLLMRASARDRERFLQGAAGDAARILLASEHAEPTPTADLSLATLHALFWLCANVATMRPLLLLVDDAQWADTTSMHWLHYLKQRWENLDLAVVVTVRYGEPAAELLMRLAADPEARRRVLAPLSLQGAADFIRARVDATVSDELCHRCHAATGGNPFYLREVAAELASTRARGVATAADAASVAAPPTVARVVTVRLHRLGEDALALARSIAVLGTAAGAAAAGQLAGLPHDAALVAADRLTAVGLLAPDPPLRFAHAVVRAAVYGDMAAAERVRAHHRAARLLIDSGAGAELAAAHLLHTEAAHDIWTVTVLREAASVATDRGAPDGAVTYLRRALDEDRATETASLLHELGRAEFECQDPAAIEHLRAAAAVATPGDQAAAIACDLAAALAVADRSEESIGVLDAALIERSDRDDEPSLRLEAHLLGSGFLHPSTRALHAEYMSRARQRAIPDTPAGRQVLAALAGCTALHGLPSAETTSAVAHALSNGQLLGSVVRDSQVFHLAANALLYCGRYHEYVDWMTSTIQIARESGSMRGLWMGCCSRSWGRLKEGNLRAAEADARTALESGIRRGWALQAVAALVEVLIETGRLTDAADVVGTGEAAQPDTPATLDQFLVFSRGRVRLQRRDACGALVDFEAVGEALARCGFADPTMWPWRSQAALCLAALGRRAGAIELAAEQVRLASAVGAPGAHGTALRTLGVLVGGREGLAHLEGAMLMLEESEARFEHARALVDVGAALRRQGSRPDARRMLTRAHEIAHECGATALEDRARAELLAAGARPRRIATTGRDALTASELRIAEMASHGLGNAELAQALFVSPKTIDTHLTHIYGKLDIHSRRELSDALAAGSSP